MLMKIFQTTILIITGVFLDTSDIYSDLSLAMTVISNGYTAYGIAILMPVVATFLTTFIAWYETELDTTNEKKWTWILVMLQVTKILLRK